MPRGSAMTRDAAHPSLDVPGETAALATITIIGGAYHEVRRIFAAWPERGINRVNGQLSAAP